MKSEAKKMKLRRQESAVSSPPSSELNPPKLNMKKMLFHPSPGGGGIQRRRIKQTPKKSLPEFFKPLMWSYDFSKIDPDQQKKTIIINTINYGNLNHWKWIISRYGTKIIQDVLTNIPASEVRPQALKLASIIFSIKNFNYAPRGAK